MESTAVLNQSLDNLFETIVQSSPDVNVFVSTLSIALAFAMLAEGTSGQTLSKIVKAFGFDSFSGLSQESLTNIFELVDRKNGAQLDIANSLWANKNSGVSLNKDFVSKIKEKYRGNVESVSASDAVPVINQWIESKTNNKIKDCLDRVSSDFLMILVNAIYFKGNWATIFDKSQTAKRDFNLMSGEKVPTDFMSIQTELNFYGDENATYISLPYLDSSISFVIALPDEAGAENLKALSAKNAAKAPNSNRNQQFTLVMPKFKIEYKTELSKILSTLGLESLFKPNPELLKIAQTPDAFISEVIHQTFIDVNEVGTEAAGATAIVSRGMSAYLVADRPFKYYIIDGDSDMVLFAGVYNTPDREETKTETE